MEHVMGTDIEKWMVLKFGGTSVSSRENWERIAEVVAVRRREGARVCVVHSALAGVSNRLQELIDGDTEKGRGAAVDAIREQHLELARDLELDGETLLGGHLGELERLVRGIELVGEAGYRVQARLMGLGELMATALGAAWLDRRLDGAALVDARDLLESVPQRNVGERAEVLSAVCDIAPDPQVRRRLSEAGPVVLTQGFIARDPGGQTVLLGRGGSDASAAYLAAKIGAERLEIWTDVPGMFSANPHQVPSARLLRRLSYAEAQEIATNGARVLHPRCIRPAREHAIPIHVRCTQRPELEGTVISGSSADEEAMVKALAVRSDVVLVSMESLGMWQQVGFLSDTFAVFKKHGLSIDLVSTSESNVTVSLDPGLNAHFRQVEEAFVGELQEHCRVKIIGGVSAVSLLGRNIRTILHQLGPAFEVFQEQHVYLLSQAANDLNFTFVVDSSQAGRLVRQLHEQVITQSGNRHSFGPTWTELMGDGQPEDPVKTAWWNRRREELLRLGGERSPRYVYDRQTLRGSALQMLEMSSVDRIFYAMKANAHPGVLRELEGMGLGLECVSIGEVACVLELFPDIDPGRVLFTPNFAPRGEYVRGFGLGVRVTLDNIYPLRQWPELFEGREVFLRIDPGYGHGHHRHVKTGGTHSKFGIPRFEIPEVARRAEELGLKVRGLHAHTGSGIKDPLAWKNTALALHEVAQELGGVDILDLGGGFGVRENETQSAVDLERVDEALDAFRRAWPGYEIWVEPGRYLVAEAGVLLTRVTQLKGKGNVRYLGVDTGMNSFIRPALYGARHTIVNLSRLEEPSDSVVNVVGPICESGDKLGIDRHMPESQEGDVILIAHAGAYGRVMSSSYNLRPPASEEMI
ncbi:MAG: bifunctional aspartate kinase/diaminopimelate decarboxylase [Balneolaceae bacterium]|nr:bifunctional aspartate kinase/diaminopimelate decarboxylase [Balneolaceae bacterium]